MLAYLPIPNVGLHHKMKNYDITVHAKFSPPNALLYCGTRST